MRLKYYELHQTPNERQKAKWYFLWLISPPSWEKAKRCVYGLGFLRPNPRPSPNNNFIGLPYFFFLNLLNPDSELLQPLQRPHQIENVFFSLFFHNFKKSHKISKKSLKNFFLQWPENFLLQRPHQIETFFLLFLIIFKNRPKFQRKFLNFFHLQRPH